MKEYDNNEQNITVRYHVINLLDVWLADGCSHFNH